MSDIIKNERGNYELIVPMEGHSATQAAYDLGRFDERERIMALLENQILAWDIKTSERPNHDWDWVSIGFSKDTVRESIKSIKEDTK